MKCLAIGKFAGCVLSILLISVGLQNTCYAFEDGTSQQTQEYVIGAEDVLEVSVWKNPDLSREVTVRPDGKISLPLIGDIQAAGRTAETLRKAILEMVKKYQENAVVSIIVKNINSYKIYVLGEVVKPGLYTLKAKTTLLQAIALAGGFTQFASKNRIVVVRESVADGKEKEKITVRFDDIVDPSKEWDMAMFLRSGDTIFVP